MTARQNWFQSDPVDVSVEAHIASDLPAQKASAEAARGQAQVELDKTVVYAGLDGTVEQFSLRKGDIVNPFMRPAGVLIPTEAGSWVSSPASASSRLRSYHSSAMQIPKYMAGYQNRQSAQTHVQWNNTVVRVNYRWKVAVKFWEATTSYLRAF